MQIIKGNKNEKEKAFKEKRKQRFSIFERIFFEETYIVEEKNLKKCIFAGINFCNLYEINTKSNEIEIKNLLLYMQFVTDMMKELTFEEFVNLFPISKEYNSNSPKEKFTFNDYFCTKELLSQYDMKDEIGDNIYEIMMSYNNSFIRQFSCKQLVIIDKFNRAFRDKKTSILEDFFIENNIEIDVIVRDEENGMFYNKNTGEVFEEYKPKKQLPKHITPVFIQGGKSKRVDE